MKSYPFLFLIVAVLMQLYVPSRMIYDSQHVISNGNTYRFRVAPIDPSDPFRGKYIVLRYEADSYPVDSNEDWDNAGGVYVQLANDSSGFAKISGLYREIPAGENDYVKAAVSYVEYDTHIAHVNYPFTKFYMEESKSRGAEELVRNAVRDTNQVAFAIVNVYHGNAIVADVRVNNVSITRLLEDHPD